MKNLFRRMRVSVLLACYNGEKYLREQIESILNQSFKDFTLFISDDGSTDDTLEIINEYVMKDVRIKLLSKHEPNKSACRHFLYMLENIQSDLYLFCDQDDVWLDNHVLKFVEEYNSLSEIEKTKPVLIHSDLKIVDSKLSVISDSYFNYDRLPKNPDAHFYFQMNNVTGCVSMINNSLKEYVFSDPNVLKNNSDKILMHDSFFASIASEFGRKIFIDEPLILYRQHGNNVCGVGEGWNLKSFIKKCFSIEQHKVSYEHHKVYACFFAEYFKKQLPEKEYTCLISYSKLNENNKIKRILFLAKNGFLRLGLIRNIWICIAA